MLSSMDCMISSGLEPVRMLLEGLYNLNEFNLFRTNAEKSKIGNSRKNKQ